MRIEFTERYLVPHTEEQLDEADRANLPLPPREAKYRRIYMKLKDVFAVKEWTGKKNHCYIETEMGDMIPVKGSYDEICQLVDDREAQDYDYEGEFTE
jgi:hypothetical protein